MRLIYLAVAAAAAGGMYLAALPADWEWHQQVAAGAIAVVVFLALRPVFGRRRSKK